MSGKRTGPPLSLSLALVAGAGFVAVVGVLAGSPKGGEPSQVVLQVPVSSPATARPAPATAPVAGATPLAVNAPSPVAPAAGVGAPALPLAVVPVAAPAAIPAAIPAAPSLVPSVVIPTVVLEATPTAAPSPTGRSGERITQAPVQVEVLDATSRAS